MAKHSPRRLATAVLAVGLVTGAAVVGAGPAQAASTSPADTGGPAPICWSAPVICVPQTWYVPTSVITNDGLLQLLPTAVEANTTSGPTQMTQTVTVSGSLTASLSGDIPLDPAGIAGGVAKLVPGVSGTISGSDAEQGFVDIPAGYVGYLKFGIIYAQTNGIAYFRNINGQVTSRPEVATAPIGFGYIASSAPIQNNGSNAATHSTVVLLGK